MPTNEIRSLVREYLAAAAPEATGIHYGTAPASATPLYVVFGLEDVAFESGLVLQELEVDVVDYGEGTAVAEDVADQILASLDHRYILTDTLQAVIYRERRQPVYEDDKSIIKRRLTFSVRAHERSY